MESKINYPRIVSLSTVGILKHYHQDYLIHPIRTDFVGSNGVGKSIIADLFQLLFITDKGLIEFGTEGLNKELRRIETIPYNTNEAFIFLNIEVFKDNFITIGTCIPNKSTPLKQFIILRDYDLNKKIEELSYDKSLFLTYKDFLNPDGSIPSSQELSKNLRENKYLFLKYFTYKEEKQEFYNWLFVKEILPINLSIEENLKAFAKVIQSFSKAKTLKIEKSESLKAFLFDDAERENKKRFDQLKDELNKLLIDYHSLSNEILDIETKQSELEKLKKLETERNNAYLNFSKAEVIFLYHKLNKQKKEYQKISKQFEKVKGEAEVINFRLEEITPLLSNAKNNYDMSDKNLVNLLQFQNHYNNLRNLEKELFEIEKTKIPEEENKLERNRSLKESNEQEIVSFSLEELEEEIKKFENLKLDSDKTVELINKSIPFYNSYISASSIIHKYQEQQETYDRIKKDIEQQISEFHNIIRILNLTKKDTVFNWALTQRKELNIAQETILFHLIDVVINKPSEVAANLKYTENPEVLFQDSYVEDVDNNGIWFNLGKLIEFIPYKKEQRLFEKTANLNKALSNKKEEILDKLKKAKSQLEELSKIKRGEVYSKDLINFYPFDERLFDYSKVLELKESEHLVLNKEKHFEDNQRINSEYRDKIGNHRLLKDKRDTILAFIDKLKRDITESEGKILQLKKDANDINNSIKKVETDVLKFESQITISITRNNLDVQINELTKDKEDYKREFELLQDENKELSSQKSSKEAIIASLTTQLKQKEDEVTLYTSDYETKSFNFQQAFREEEFVVELESEITDEFLEGLRSIKDNTKNKYELYYQELPEKFQETKNGGNAEINEQFSAMTFSFIVMEQVLLGGKIGHLDKITPYLTEANEQRINIANTIYETMLKIFTNTKDQYENYEVLIKDLNTFFTGKKISNAYFFNINFSPKQKFNIGWIDSLYYKGKNINKIDEVFYNRNNDVESFVIDFFQKEVKGVKVANISELLNPKNYFDLSVSLTDENKKPIPGSTGETYSAITLLGIGRLSIVQNSDRKGIRFIILEETASLDNTNFNTFPDIASEFNYQLITMTPKPYGSDSEHGWYLHNLIKGKSNRNINYPIPASYFKTNNTREDLNTYLIAKNK